MISEVVKIEKLVYGGQGLAEMIDGRKVFVWNALPGELVKINVTKQKSTYYEAEAVEIIKPSKLRKKPKDYNYLATSPWQIIDLEEENKFKIQFVNELITHHEIDCQPISNIFFGQQQWHYRNKMEYNFWGDEQGISLALHKRDSHTKDPVTGSSLAMKSIDSAAADIVKQLNDQNIYRASDIKSVIIRSNQANETIASLFVRSEASFNINLTKNLVGIEIFYSNPKSPASIATRLINRTGQTSLNDQLIDGISMSYGSRSFFQVNVPVYRQVLSDIKKTINLDNSRVIDLYCGVGSIGLSVSNSGSIIMLDNDSSNIDYLKLNASTLTKDNYRIIKDNAENFVDEIMNDDIIIIDPPRNGLHSKLIEKILISKPKTICYLSCNPITQIRDIKLLADIYQVESYNLYNFFPHTPHIESLAILSIK